MKKLLLIIIGFMSTLAYAGPVKTIELLGVFISSSTSTNPSDNIKIVNIDCAMVSTQICATLTVPGYQTPHIPSQSFPIMNDYMEAGQVFHLETPAENQSGTIINATQVDDYSSNIRSFQLEAQEIDYNDYPESPTKEIDVIGLYQRMTTTSSVLINTGDGPVIGSQTKVYCALVSNSVCFKMEVADLSIPQTMNPQTHNGALPSGYYRSITIDGIQVSGQFYYHYQNFTDGTLTEREHTIQYVPNLVIFE